MIVDIILLYLNWMWNTVVSVFDMSATVTYFNTLTDSLPTVMGYLMNFDFVLPVQLIVGSLVYIVGVYFLYLVYWFVMLMMLIWRTIKIL